MPIYGYEALRLSSMGVPKVTTPTPTVRPRPRPTTAPPAVAPKYVQQKYRERIAREEAAAKDRAEAEAEAEAQAQAKREAERARAQARAQAQREAGAAKAQAAAKARAEAQARAEAAAAKAQAAAQAKIEAAAAAARLVREASARDRAAQARKATAAAAAAAAAVKKAERAKAEAEAQARAEADARRVEAREARARAREEVSAKVRAEAEARAREAAEAQAPPPSVLPVFAPPPEAPVFAPPSVVRRVEVMREAYPPTEPKPPLVTAPKMVEELRARGLIPTPPRYVPSVEVVAEPAPPPFEPALAPELTYEEYEEYRHLPGEEQLAQQIAWGVIPEGSEFAGWTSDPKTGIGHWTYLTPEVLAGEAAREEALAGLSEFRVNGGYDLAGAFAAGLGAKVHATAGLGLFTPEQIVESQFGQIKVASLARAQADIQRIAPAAVTVEDGKTFIDLAQARAVGVPESTLRLAGFGREEVVAASSRAEALETLAPYYQEPREVPAAFGFEMFRRYGVGGYDVGEMGKALAGGEITAATLVAAGFAPEQVKATEAVAFAPPEIVGLRVPTVEVPLFETWLEQKGVTTEVLRGLVEKGGLEGLEASMLELKASYEHEYGLGFWGTPLGRLEKWSVEKPYATIGAIAAVPAVLTAPAWAPLAVPAFMGVVKAGAIATVATGVPLTVAGAFLPPSETELEKLGWYGRGVEQLWMPGMEWIREALPGPEVELFGLKLTPGGVITGVAGYFAPHELFAQKFPEKGALAATTLIPHFGPTAAYTALTWEEQPLAGKIAGIGLTVLPYAVGPAAQAFRWAGGVVGKVPVLGPTLRAVTWAPRQVVGLAGEVVRPLHFEAWAPWRGAYELSGLAGRAGLARVPVLGTAGAKWGWWAGPPAPPAPPVTVKDLRLPPFKRVYIDIEKALRGPRLLPSEKAYVPRPGDVPYPWEQPIMGAKGIVGYEKGVSWIKGAPYPGEAVYAPPGIIQQVQMSSGWAQFTKFVQQMPTYAPRIAAIGAVTTPLAMGAFLPMVAPIVETSTLARIDITVVNQMLAQKVITPTLHQQITTQIQRLQAQNLTPQVYEQRVQTVIQQRLTTPQQQEFKVQEQQVTQQQAQEVELARTSTLAKIDTAAIDQMLKEGQITTIQYDQIVTQIQELQAQELAPAVYEQEVRTIVQQQLDVAQQQQMETVEQQIIEQQQQEVQEQIVQQQKKLQEMQQQQVQQLQIQEQQVVVQQLQQIYDQIIQMQEVIPPVTPPDVPTPGIIPPFLPLFPGAPSLGVGFARGLRVGRGRFEEGVWPFPEMILSMPEFLSLQKKKIKLAKKRTIPYGARVLRRRVGRLKGIRV